MTLDRDVVDAAGRHGVGIDLGAVRSPESRLTLILDRRTYRLLGTRDSSVVHFTDDATGKRYDERAVVVTAILRTAVVPTAGKAP
ncbi:hypothetical protein [Actinomadura decatromicini]|uniref:Uncharacterized protein n=1 Tax=Actinomadura decatromicini TaxID=2604572 RepID=A0A5D3FAQ4_9ACTN|nr:hypothetical protein [Actinomadura decatromicini]TYK44984.1 hypothetical protein FXF68_30250 [Actinomadura decatromicini]